MSSFLVIEQFKTCNFTDLLCPEFPQECFDHEGVINGHIHFLPNNRKQSRAKNNSHKTNVAAIFSHFFVMTNQD